MKQETIDFLLNMASDLLEKYNLLFEDTFKHLGDTPKDEIIEIESRIILKRLQLEYNEVRDVVMKYDLELNKKLFQMEAKCSLLLYDYIKNYKK